MESLRGGRWGFWQTRAMRRSKSWRRLRFGGGRSRQLTWRASVATSSSRPAGTQGENGRAHTQAQHSGCRTSAVGPRSWGAYWGCWRRLRIGGTSAAVPWVAGSNLLPSSARPSRTPGTPAVCFHCHWALWTHIKAFLLNPSITYTSTHCYKWSHGEAMASPLLKVFISPSGTWTLWSHSPQADGDVFNTESPSEQEI